MKVNNFSNFFILMSKNLGIFLIFSIISFNNCLLEIPLKPLKIKGEPKYRIKIKEPQEYSDINYINKTILINEGVSTLNDNILFLANIKIGSDEQTFNLVLDTGSFLLWVPIINSNDKYKITNHYNPSTTNSETKTTKTFEQRYGTGYCSGALYYDNFKYIKTKSFKVKFGAASVTDFNVEGGDGIIGLAHDYDDEELSFIHMLKKSKVTDSKIFSFKFEGNLDIGMKGKLYIGKHKDFSSGDSVTCPLLTFNGQANIFWASYMSSLGLENSKYKAESSKEKYIVIFDTGTNLIILPKFYYNNLKNKLDKFGCEGFTTKDNYVQLRCNYNNRVDFRIKVNTHVFIIPKDLIFYPSGSYYYSRVVFADNSFVGGAYIIGNPFFLLFHTLFDKDNEKLHFYPIYKELLEKGSGSGSDSTSIFAIIFVLTFVIVILGVFCYKFYQWKKVKREDIPSSNYSGYNSNFI